MVKSLRILLPFKPTNSTRSHPTGWMGEIEWIVLSHISYTSLTTSGSSTTSLWTTTFGGTSTWRRGWMCSKQLNNWWKQIRMRFWKREKFQWRWILTLSIGIASKKNLTVFGWWRQNNAQSATQSFSVGTSRWFRSLTRWSSLYNSTNDWHGHGGGADPRIDWNTTAYHSTVSLPCQYRSAEPLHQAPEKDR